MSSTPLGNEIDRLRADTERLLAEKRGEHQAVPISAETYRVLVSALLVVHHEVSDGVRPYSADSYLPNHIRDQVADAVKKVMP